MTVVPVMKRVLVYGGILALLIAVVGSGVGFLVAGGPGVVSALLGTSMAVVFLAITAVSIIVASRFDLVAFFGIVMGAWLLKFVLFLVLIFVLKDQPWVNPLVLYICIVAGAVGTVVVDAVVVLRSRMSYVSDPKPHSDAANGAGVSSVDSNP